MLGLGLPTDSALTWEASGSLLLDSWPCWTFPKDNSFLQIQLIVLSQPQVRKRHFFFKRSSRLPMVSILQFFLHFQTGEALSLVYTTLSSFCSLVCEGACTLPFLLFLILKINIHLSQETRSFFP